jgi:hypothetical protein
VHPIQDAAPTAEAQRGGGELIRQAYLWRLKRLSVDTLLDSVLQFPTFSQENLAALENMDL